MARSLRLRRRAAFWAVAFIAALSSAEAGAAGERTLTLATTTTTENSGLMGHLLPLFEAGTGIEVRVVLHGTGQVLRAARAGDVDLFIAHDKEAELAFLAQGYGIERRDLMSNDFVIVGPADDPAGINGMTDAAQALARIAASSASPFVSRGDDSGTHRAERRLWQAAGIDPSAASGEWYLEAGAGMGSTLNIAAGRGAYTLTDRGTWLSFGNRGDLVILTAGDPRLFNQYGITLVNPSRHPYVKAAEARAFFDWITGPDGQRAIAAYQIDGEQPFHPNAEGRQ